ncbi:HET-domain-containing protein [Jackrogersella minutella]|nr:HET-domain-containing protein [Jackrogersella minutella]
MIYQPLDVSRFEARLLRFLESSSEPDQPLRFEVLTYSLIRPPEYFALSYCWGDSLNQSPIEVDGEIIYVSRNLAAALRHSGFHPGTLIWADAICIDQHNVNEKAHQIRLMGLIYSKAQATAVWLGEEGRDTQCALTFLEEIGFDQNQMSHISNDVFIRTLRNTRRPVRSLRGLYELLIRPYWERVWIIQEISKARTVWVRCGSLYFNLGSLIACSEHVDGLLQRNRILISTIQEFRLQELEARRGGPRMTLLQALIRSRYSLATNPRDKIYALLNLARDGNDLVPTPTYTEPVEEVFRELTMVFLQSPHPMEAAILSTWAPVNVGSEIRPSWLVDWSDLSFNVPPWITSNLPARFNGPMKEKGFGAPTFLSDLAELRGRGQSLGFINSVSDLSVDPTVELQPEERQNSCAIMCSFCSNLYRMFFSESPNSQTMSQMELTRALVFMIAGTDDELTWGSQGKGHMTVSINIGGLNIDGVYLRAWARAFVDYEASLQKRMPGELPWKAVNTKMNQIVSSDTSSFRPLEFPNSSLRKKHLPHILSNQLSLAAFRVWNDAFSTIDLSLEYGLRFATSGNNIVLVPRAAQAGDEIYRLDSCYFPIVLRKITGDSQGRHNIIGEACIGIDSDRNWIAARDCPWLARYQPETLDLLV